MKFKQNVAINLPKNAVDVLTNSVVLSVCMCVCDVMVECVCDVMVECAM